MKIILTAGLVIALAGCAAQSPQMSASSKAKVEKCWKQAGIPGDLYKFYNPKQDGQLVEGGVVTQPQADSFNACIAAP